MSVEINQIQAQIALLTVQKEAAERTAAYLDMEGDYSGAADAFREAADCSRKQVALVKSALDVNKTTITSLQTELVELKTLERQADELVEAITAEQASASSSESLREFVANTAISLLLGVLVIVGFFGVAHIGARLYLHYCQSSVEQPQ